MVEQLERPSPVWQRASFPVLAGAISGAGAGAAAGTVMAAAYVLALALLLGLTTGAIEPLQNAEGRSLEWLGYRIERMVMGSVGLTRGGCNFSFHRPPSPIEFIMVPLLVAVLWYALRRASVQRIQRALVVGGILGATVAAMCGGILAGLALVTVPIAFLVTITIGLTSGFVTGVVAAAFIGVSLGLFGGLMVGAVLGMSHAVLAPALVPRGELRLNLPGLAAIIALEAGLAAYYSTQTVIAGMLGGVGGAVLAGAVTAAIGYLTLSQACGLLIKPREAG